MDGCKRAERREKARILRTGVHTRLKCFLVVLVLLLFTIIVTIYNKVSFVNIS